MQPIIVTAAVTGAATVPTLTPYLPKSPAEIADAAVEAAAAGAAIVHIHARRPQDGMPSVEADHLREIITAVKSRCDAVINISTGGHARASVAERAANVSRFKPELCSFNLGSMNFGLHPLLAKISDWQYEWEPAYLELSKDFVFKNTFADLYHLCHQVREHAVKPEFEAYDVGHLYNLAHLVREERVDLPLHIQFVMGVLGGIGIMAEDLTFLVRKACTLFGASNFTWSVCGVGAGQFNLAPLAITQRGHVRVGLEDNIYLYPGVLARSNAELVEKACQLAQTFGRPVASPAEARRMLGLKGAERVAF